MTLNNKIMDSFQKTNNDAYRIAKYWSDQSKQIEAYFPQQHQDNKKSEKEKDNELLNKEENDLDKNQEE